MPTVVFSVTDDKGEALKAVKVFSADELIAESLDGSAIAVDPGKHRFRFVLPSGEVLSTDELIREGEKDRVISVDMSPLERQPAPLPPPQTPAPSPDGGMANSGMTPAEQMVAPAESSRRGPTVGFWVASGIGAGALASFATAALIGRSIHADLADCSPDCGSDRRDDYDALRRSYLAADISLGIAVVSVGTAAYLYFNPHPFSGRSQRSARRARPAARVSLVSSKTAVTVELRGAF
jgi:hypothetical protein